MSLVTRYLLKNVFTVTLFVTVSLTMVIWLTQSLKLLELIASSDAPAGMFVKLVALTLPRFLEIILPLSLVTGILFVYHKMILDNELIVLRACGFDQHALARPVLLLALSMTLLLLLLTTWLSPKGYAEMQLMRQSVKSEYSAFLLREGVFNTFDRDLTVYVRKRDNRGDLTGLLIHDTRDKNKPPVTITARRGQLVMDGEMPQIVVYDGMRQQLERRGNSLSRLYFSRYTIEIKGLGGTRPTRFKEASERTLLELLNPDMTQADERSNADLFKAEAHHRIVAPFNALSFAVVALCCLLLGPFNRRGQTRKIMLAAVVVVLLQTLSLSLLSAAKKHLGFIPLFYVFTFAPLLAGLYLLTLSGEQALDRLIKRLRGHGSKQAEVTT